MTANDDFIIVHTITEKTTMLGNTVSKRHQEDQKAKFQKVRHTY